MLKLFNNMAEKIFKLSIGKKILIGFSIISLIYLGMALHNYYEMNNIGNLAEQAVPLSSRITSLQDFAIQMEKLDNDMQKYFITNYEQDKEDVNNDFENMFSILRSLEINDNGNLTPRLHEMDNILFEIQQDFNNVPNTDQNATNSDLINEKRALIYNLIDTEKQKHLELLTETTNEINNNVLYQQQAILHINNDYIYLSIIFLSLGILISFRTSRSISSPIEKLREATTEIGQGRFDINIPDTSMDEIGELASAFNKMTGELQKTTVSKEYVENIIRSMYDTLIVASPEGTIQTVNNAICNLLGYRSDELLGKPISMIFNDQQPMNKSIDEIRKKDILFNIEEIYTAKDGRKIPVLSSISKLMDNEGNIQGIVCVAKDITQIKKAEEALSELSQFNQEVISSAGEGIIVYDTEFRYLIWNKFMEKMTQVMQKDVLGKVAFDIFPHLREQGIDNLIKKAMNGETVSSNDTPYRIPGTGNSGWVNSMYVPHRDTNGKIKGVIATVRDVTECKNTEDLLNKSKEFAEIIINSMKDAIYVIDVIDFKIIEVNSVFLEIYGMKKEEVIGRTCYEITHKRAEPCTSPEEKCPLSETLTTGKHSTAEHIHYTKHGQMRYNEVSTSPIKDKNGKIVNVIHVTRDITERKLAEEQIARSLKDKETLLKEIHHRVKNNMQIVSSLLDHQIQYIEDKKIISMFKESQNRILSMSLVHEKLYQSRDLARINFFDYINDLVANLFQSYMAISSKITPSIDIENIQLDIDFAIPCGLIINELVTNSLKYAFSEEAKGEIRIVFRRTCGDMYELIVSDNGIGISADIDFRKTGSMGLHLVTILSEHQLHGEINLIRKKGTEFQIKFRGIK